MGRPRVRAQYAFVCVLCVCVLCVCVASNVKDYCEQLKENNDLKLEPGLGSEIRDRALSLKGEPRKLKLCARDAAPMAARAILRALLVYRLRYRAHEIEEADCSLEELQRLTDTIDEKHWVLSVATAWRQEGTITALCYRGACGLAGSRLDVMGRGAAPAVRRLLARLAPGAPFYCLQDWDKLRLPECGFLEDSASYTNPCSDWNITCSGNCVTVAIEPGKYEAQQCHLAHELSEVAGPLRLTSTLERANRSYLFFAYDIWIDSNKRIWSAPYHNRTTPDAVSLLLGDVLKLLHYAPRILSLAYRLQPPPDMLRRVLSSELDINTAACEAIVATNESIAYARDWLTCNDSFCDLKPRARIYVCREEENNDNRYSTIKRIVQSYWRNMTNQAGLDLINVKIDCSITDVVKSDLERAFSHYELHMSLRGVVAMGSGGASSLPQLVKREEVPLLLVGTPPSADLAGARSTAPAVPALALAVRRLLDTCGWHRVALLREEGRSDIWKRSLGVAEALGNQDLVPHQEIVHADNASVVLDALKASDARVVLIDASAETASNVLLKAEEQGLTTTAGYAWLVIGAAGNSSDSDWLPTKPEFSYVTVSGGWRGGHSPHGLFGSTTLRNAIDNQFQRWPPHASALVDALLLMLEGSARLEKLYPEHRDDPHRPGVVRKFFELLDNTTVVGVTHNIRANSSPPLFAHRWTSDGAQLVSAWDGNMNNIYPIDKDQLCGGVLDGPGCYTTRSGERFTPHCHDFAWAILVCALALGLPSLYAARAVRRRRLRRRDRAVEERVLLRGGHSAAEAAAGAALAEHAVPRDALQLLDELGTGHYGVVHQAVLRRPTSAALGVAVKAPRADAPAGAAAELLREAALLATLKHDHVVRFTGVCWEGGPLVLMEHAFYGDLRRYLRARRTLAERARAGLPEPEAAHVAAAALTRLAREAAAALGYLAHQRLIHRDIRAANCLVDVRRSLKLADFGMARRLDKTGEGEYLCKRRAMFPVLWMAPESLSRGVFSTASDVWALGVLLLELATLGERPYGAWTTPRVLRHVREGGTPPLPQDVAPSTRGITATCWHRSPEERPSAAELVAYFAEHPRAIQPALEPYVDADTNAYAAPETDSYIEEWTN